MQANCKKRPHDRIRYHCRTAKETMRARIPHGAHSGVRSSALCRHNMVRFCISGRKARGAAHNRAYGTQGNPGRCLFFGKRLRALELNLLRPEGSARICTTVEACSSNAKLMAWRCDLTGNNATTNKQVESLMKAIGNIATESTSMGATTLP